MGNHDSATAGKRRAEDVAEELRNAVVQGDFAPGQRLVETELCELYRASRSAVRTALRQLADEGLVEVERHKGARVRLISLEEAIEITEVRRSIEGLVAAKAAERVKPEHINELEEIGVQMRVAVEQHDAVQYSELNRRLHSAIRDISGQKTAALILHRLHAQLVRHRFRLALRAGRPAASLEQHERIISAVVAGHPREAEAAMRDHLSDVLNELIAMDAAAEQEPAGASGPLA